VASQQRGFDFSPDGISGNPGSIETFGEATDTLLDVPAFRWILRFSMSSLEPVGMGSALNFRAGHAMKLSHASYSED
jgi:hypothetical protein